MSEHEHHHHEEHAQRAPSALELRVRALEALLTEKGYIDPAALDVLIDAYQTKIGPRNGAQVVARAWCDPEFRRWLMSDATSAIASLGFAGRQGEHMVAVENTPDVHNMVVCTLCSCYPWSVLGLPPTWYKSAPYRARAVKDPRGVLQEFGVELPQSTQIRIWDSTAEVRYLVLPQRPAGTEHLSERELADLVTRDSMIGTGLPKTAVMTYRSHADLGGQDVRGAIIQEPEGEYFHAALGAARHGAGGRHGTDRHVEYRHEPRGARNAAELSRLELLRDLAGRTGKAGAARRACSAMRRLHLSRCCAPRPLLRPSKKAFRRLGLRRTSHAFPLEIACARRGAT